MISFHSVLFHFIPFLSHIFYLNYWLLECWSLWERSVYSIAHSNSHCQTTLINFSQRNVVLSITWLIFDIFSHPFLYFSSFFLNSLRLTRTRLRQADRHKTTHFITLHAQTRLTRNILTLFLSWTL